MYLTVIVSNTYCKEILSMLKVDTLLNNGGEMKSSWLYSLFGDILPSQEIPAYIC